MNDLTSSFTPFEQELSEVLIQALNLEDLAHPTPEAPLFGAGGWGLDSIDALEIALAVQQRYGVQLRAEDESTKQAFANLRSLAALVSARRV